MATKALYAGTFDPFTNGHLDIARRAMELFDELTIVVAVPPLKTPYMSAETRVKLIEEIFKKDNVKVVSWGKLIVDYARENGISAIVRGLRPTGDFESEFQMATMNKKINPNVETVFIPTGGANYFISSSLVKEIFKFGGEVSEFVPKNVLDKMKNLKG